MYIYIYVYTKYLPYHEYSYVYTMEKRQPIYYPNRATNQPRDTPNLHKICWATNKQNSLNRHHQNKFVLYTITQTRNNKKKSHSLGD